MDDDYLQQGLGSLVCRALSKQLGKMGLDVCACVGPENTASCKLFERIGFTVIAPTYWIRNYPTVPTNWVD